MRDYSELAELQAVNSAIGFCSGVAAAFGYSDTIGEGMPWPEAWSAACDDLIDATERARRAELWHSFGGNGPITRPMAKAARLEVERLQAEFVDLMRPRAEVSA